jgi:predicted outer membrane repeat protein
MRNFCSTASLLFSSLMLSSSVSALQYVVTRADDPDPSANCIQIGGCGLSLRQAVLAANKRPGPDVIVLSRNIYELTRATSSSTPDGKSGPLLVTDTLEVIGDSAARTVVRWKSGSHLLTQHRHQVWFAGTDGGSLALEKLTVSHGRGSSGGCIYRAGTGYLALQDVVVESCSGKFGGAINQRAASVGGYTLSLKNTELRNNQAEYQGGAVYLSQSATIIADGASLMDNTALGDGGAFFAATNVTPLLSLPLNIVWRSEGAGTLFEGNNAGGDGGAIALTTPGFANIYAVAGSPLIRFENNVAGGAGGAVSAVRSYFSAVSPARRDLSSPSGGTRLTLERASMALNGASKGGAVALLGTGALIVSSYFKSNAALSGNGGAVFADYSTAAPTEAIDVEIRQSSFNQNGAMTGFGGALANECQRFNVRDSAFYANSAAQGEAISATGSTFMAHISTNGHGAVEGNGPVAIHKRHHTMCGTQSFAWANSIVSSVDRCGSQFGTFTSFGGNAYGPYGNTCPMIGALDQSGNSGAYHLMLGTFGGEFDVLGWNNDGQARPQINFGQAAYCSATDIRGMPRSDGACDSGAFEQ